MPPAAVPVTLTASERKTLKMRVRAAKTHWRDRLRAQIVLAAARGGRTRGSPLTWGWMTAPSASGGGGSRSCAWTG